MVAEGRAYFAGEVLKYNIIPQTDLLTDLGPKMRRKTFLSVVHRYEPCLPGTGTSTSAVVTAQHRSLYISSHHHHIKSSNYQVRIG